MKDITDAGYTHRKVICKNFRIKNLGEYHDLYLECDTLLANASEDFQNMCLQIYKLDPAHILTATSVASSF